MESDGMTDIFLKLLPGLMLLVVGGIFLGFGIAISIIPEPEPPEPLPCPIQELQENAEELYQDYKTCWWAYACTTNQEECVSQGYTPTNIQYFQLKCLVAEKGEEYEQQFGGETE